MADKIKCKKVSYSSQVFALEDLIRIVKKSDRDTVPIRAYKCDFCGKWHLTSHKDKLEDKIQKYLGIIRELRANNKELKIIATKHFKHHRKYIENADKSHCEDNPIELI